MKLHLPLQLLLLLSVQFLSCNVIEEIVEKDKSKISADDYSVSIRTTEETLLFATTVTLNGSITYEGNLPNDNRTYFFISKEVSKPTELLSSGNKVVAQYKNKKGPAFSAKISSLEPNTTYYYIASFEVSGQLAYTPVATFTTKSNSYEPESYEAVDLALSVKWANMNLGAVSPEDYGAFFSWGETTTKSSFSWSTVQ